ncbi:MAG: NgoFVII family restriction endonuclease [Treponemataceae bacterium]|nr:NgoFVII family restriction endonuclease [Treponemataceae bacterium]
MQPTERISINSNLDYPIGKIINQELQNSEKTQIAVAFLKSSGVDVIRDSLLRSLDNGGKFELIVGLDFKTTDPKAMKYFLDLKRQYKGVDFYCYGDKRENRNDVVFHPKIYLFKNSNENISIVGSTNLTRGGLESNFEVNAIFNEKNPIQFSKLQAIYNSVKYTDSLFTPDEEYLMKYSDIFHMLEKNEYSTRKDKSVRKIILEIQEKESQLPGTIPSLKKLLVEFLKSEKAKNHDEVTLNKIYEYLEERVKDPIFAGRFKMDTFRNSVRGEINHNEYSNTEERSLRLFKRVGNGVYSLSEFGDKFEGR